MTTEQQKPKGYDGLTPGVYSAGIADWGFREITMSGKTQLLCFITLDIEANGKVHRLAWESFLFKKDGDVSKKTIDTLATCGFKGTDISLFVSETALNMKKKVNATVELENGYWRVQWINDPDESPRGKADQVKSVVGYDLSRVNAALAEKTMAAKPNVKNSAPGADQKSDAEKELGF